MKERILTCIVWHLPKSIMYWAVVRAAVQCKDDYPASATAQEMLEAFK